MQSGSPEVTCHLPAGRQARHSSLYSTWINPGLQCSVFQEYKSNFQVHKRTLHHVALHQNPGSQVQSELVAEAFKESNSGIEEKYRIF